MFATVLIAFGVSALIGGPLASANAAAAIPHRVAPPAVSAASDGNAPATSAIRPPVAAVEEKAAPHQRRWHRPHHQRHVVVPAGSASEPVNEGGWEVAEHRIVEGEVTANSVECDAPCDAPCRKRKRHCCESTCDMMPHVPYYPESHGYYYFRPYNFTHTLQHRQDVALWGGDPRNPYANGMFDKIYEQIEAKRAGAPMPVSTK